MDIKGPNLIKGIQFDGHRVLGTAEEFAQVYYNSGADELIYQDAVASLYNRNSLLEIVSNTAKKIFIPLTVAGGIRSIEDIRQILRAGADKVAINTAAIENPKLIEIGAKEFGTQCIVSGIDAFHRQDGSYEVWVNYGRQPTGIDAIDWALEVERLGAGEILLNSINQDGMGKGFDIELTQLISSKVNIPVISGCGAGKKEDFLNILKYGNASAISAASIFHYNYATSKNKPTMQFNDDNLRMGKSVDSGNIDFLNFGYGGEQAINVLPCSIQDVKSFLNKNGYQVRLDGY